MTYRNKSTGVAGIADRLYSSVLPVTNGVITRDVSAEFRSVWHKFSWTNAMVAALGAVTSGTLKVCTLPAKTIVKSALIRITGQAAGVTVLTCSLGKTGATYIDYIVATSAKSAVDTIIGDAIAEVGTGLADAIGSLGAIASTTDVNLRFDATAENLSLVTGSAGDIYLETVTLP